MAKNPLKNNFNYLFIKWLTYIWMIISLAFILIMGIEEIIYSRDLISTKILLLSVIFIGLITGFKYNLAGGLLVCMSFTGFTGWFWLTRGMLVPGWLWYFLISLPGVLILALAGYEYKVAVKTRQNRSKKSAAKNKKTSKK